MVSRSEPANEEGTAMTTTIDLNVLMARIQALLAKADSTEHPAEATTFRAKAEELMRKYRIDEEQLIAQDQVEILPETHEIWLGTPAGRYLEWYALAEAAARHAGVLMWHRWKGNAETGEYGIFAVMVGYSGDLRLAEMIFSAARIVFGERLEPKVDPTLSDQVNAYRLRSAGINRDRAAELIWGETSHARAAAVGRMYKAECLERGETPALDGRGINAQLYRDQYAKAFVDEFEVRLWRARDAADSAGGALVLHGRKERIQEAFWTVFPELRPKPKPAPGTDVAPVEKSPAKKGRAPKPYYETAEYRRQQERLHSETAYAARSAGKRAAREVELDRPAPTRRLPETVADDVVIRGEIG